MKLANRKDAYIPSSRLYDYLLSETHPIGRWKAWFFRALGFDETNVSGIGTGTCGGLVLARLKVLLLPGGLWPAGLRGLRAVHCLLRCWIFIPELGKHLRVVTLGDGETIHNAFPDRGFKEVRP